MPPDLWKALADSQPALGKLLDLMTFCWRTKTTPASWRTSSVVAIFKNKGNEALPENYRPISLLCVGYKVLAMLLLLRLKAGGSEKRLSATQYGFRAGRSTREPTLFLRSLFSEAGATQGGSLSAVLLDWEKAFDRLDPAMMVTALRLFGVPEDFCAMIRGIYAHRTFTVSDGWGTSVEHCQASGIAQGCPLSPYLFIIALTVVTESAQQEWQREATRPTKPVM